MNKYLLFVLLNMFFIPNLCGESFLTAQQFPATFQDLSFTQRVAVIKEGFEPYQSEFDENGVCITNCAYAGITIKQEQERSIIDTQNALAESAQYIHTQNLPIDTKNIISAVTVNTDGQYPNCANYNPGINPESGVPYGEPLIGQAVISSGYDLQRLHPITKKIKPHYGIDYAVPVGTLVYTTACGRVVNVWHDQKCGNGLKIQHNDGTYAVYCHLDSVLVNIGENVVAGCAVARSGNSGGSTAAHLHYGLKNKSDRFINPSGYVGRGA